MTLATSARKRRAWWIALALTALIAGALGSLIILWVNGAAGNPVVGWFGDWIKSPGFTGLGAIVAATIAFVGIFLQLKANRERDVDTGWWQSFEWASDRGLPRARSEVGLPFEAALDALNALATAARTDVQKNAVRGVVEELLRLNESKARNEDVGAPGSQTQSTSPGEEESTPAFPNSTEPNRDEEGSYSDGATSAVLRYALDQIGTAAESRRANASAYEAEVLSALRHVYESVLPLRGTAAGDAIVYTPNRQLVVEIKWSPGTILNLNSRAFMGNIDAVISNVRVTNLPPDVNEVVWNPRDKSFALRDKLNAIE